MADGPAHSHSDIGNDSADQDYTAVPDAIDLPEDVYERIVQQVRKLQEAVESDREVSARTADTSTGSASPVASSNAASEDIEQNASGQIDSETDDSGPQDLVQDESGPNEAAFSETGAISRRLEVDESLQPPLAPESLEAAGISLGQLSDLILKHLYLGGTLTGFEISRQLRLPFSVVSESLHFLKGERALEVSSGELVGPLSYRYLLTDRGRERARDAFEACRYVGPAPVSLDQYTQQCRRQAIRHIPLHWDDLNAAMQGLVLDPDLLRRLGPAVCSGQSIFLYGPPGNGKTVIAKGLGRWLNESGGSIYVPYAISVDNQIVSVFDPSVHRTVEGSQTVESPATTSEEEPIQEPDRRWRQVRRPVIISGGELSLDMLDLRYHANSGYYTAPLQLKANGGVFLLDDFGRQLVPAPQLLNRWILPLEERCDSLTLITGKKFTVPFEQLTIFSTNLRPEDLVDAAFLRRIRHKLEISYPSERQFREIFRKCCEQKGIKYDDWIVSRLLTSQYDPESPPKASDPRDLLDVVEAICRFRGERPHLSEKIVFEAFQECLGGPRLTR